MKHHYACSDCEDYTEDELYWQEIDRQIDEKKEAET